jgi:O-antigen/teichoic acid export membrane protein
MTLKIPSGKALNATLAQGTGLVLGFFVHLSLAHVLAIESYGLFNFIFSIASTVSMLAVFGLQSAAQRIIPSHENAPHIIHAFMRFSWIFTAVIAALMSGLVFAILALTYTQTIEPKIPLYAGGFLVAITFSIMRLHVGFLKAYHQGPWAISYETIFRELPILITVWVVVLLGLSLNNTSDIFILYGAVACVLIVTSALHIKRLTLSTGIKIETNRIEYKKWLMIATPMMLITTTQMLLHRSDIIILGLIVPLDDVGSYSFGAKLSHAASIAVVGAAAIFSPRASKLFGDKDRGGLHAEFCKSRKFMIIGTLIIGTIMAFGIHVVLYLFPDYSKALWAFYILVGGYVLNAFWGPSTYVLIMTGQEKRMMWMTFAAVGFNIIATLGSILIIGTIGAAITTALALNIRNAFAYRIYLKEYVDLHPKD